MPHNRFGDRKDVEYMIEDLIEAAKVLEEQNVPPEDRLIWVPRDLYNEWRRKYPEIVDKYYRTEGQGIILKVVEKP